MNLFYRNRNEISFEKICNEIIESKKSIGLEVDNLSTSQFGKIVSRNVAARPISSYIEKNIIEMRGEEKITDKDDNALEKMLKDLAVAIKTYFGSSNNDNSSPRRFDIYIPLNKYENIEIHIKQIIEYLNLKSIRYEDGRYHFDYKDGSGNPYSIILTFSTYNGLTSNVDLPYLSNP